MEIAVLFHENDQLRSQRWPFYILKVAILYPDGSHIES